MMKIISAAAAAFLILATAIKTEACTNLIVGKNASVDGSVMCSYSCDGYVLAGSLWFTPGGKHDAGEMMFIKGRGTKKNELIPQVDYTYNVIGLMNEHQLSIVETTFDGRAELRNKDVGLDYFSIMKLGLQRARTAREAIEVMTSLAQEYGYSSTGETITICDPEEAWIMEIVGKGPSRKGAVWVARRVPDDCICAHANNSRITHFPLNDKENCLYSGDVISFAREMGYFSGKDEDFSFRDAYCPPTFKKVRYSDTRVWSFFRHHTDTSEMDRYIPYLEGKFDQCSELPLFIRPDKKLSVRDIQHDMRDHFEGTPFDMTTDITAGPWGMPVRPMPKYYTTSDGKEYFVERPIAVQKTQYTMVCQMRSFLPDHVGGVMYFNLDEPACLAYVPIYCCTNIVPEPFRKENNDYKKLDRKSAYWANNFVANWAYPRWSLVKPDITQAQDELEDYFEKDQPAVIEKVKSMTKVEAVEYLTRKSCAYADKMLERWHALAEFIIIKHSDLVMLPSEDGHLINSGRKYESPGYNQSFIDAAAEVTGSRYEVR